MKLFVLILGFLSAALIIAQLVMGQLILSGSKDLLKSHQHAGYMTVAVSLAYIALSLIVIFSPRKRESP